MRGAEMVAGALLVAAGVVGPAALPDQMLPSVGWVEGTVWFLEARYQGSAEVAAEEAVASVEGPVAAEISADRVVVTVYEYDRYGGYVVAGYGFELNYKNDRTVTNHTFGNAVIRLSGAPNGVLHVWPSGHEPARFALALNDSKSPRIYPSPQGAAFYSDDGHHWYNIRGPAYGLQSGNYTFQGQNQSAEMGAALFDEIRATGGLELVVGNADVSVTHPRGEASYRLRTMSGFEGGVGYGSRLRGGHALGTHVSYAVIRLSGGDVRLGFEDVDAAFLARRPTWQLNGTIAFNAEEGRLAAGGEDRALDDDEVRIDGNLTIRLRAEGEDDRSGGILKGWRLPSEALPPPRSRAELTGDAQHVEVGGRALHAEPSSSDSFTKEVTLISKIVGGLLLGWALLSKSVPFVVRLFIRNPLENPRRRQIRDYIEAAGFAHLRDISRATGIPLGSLAYHLRMLRSTGCVASVRRRGYTVYFLVSPRFSLDDIRRLALLAQPTRRHISTALADAGPMTQKDLAHRLRLSRSSVSRQLTQLVDAGLVERQGSWESLYSPTSLLRAWAQNGTGAQTKNPGPAHA